MAPPREHSVYRRLSADQIAQLVARDEAGARIAALMRSYNLGKGTVLDILGDHDVKLRNQDLSPECLPEAVARYIGGQSIAALGAALECSANVIRTNLIAAGVAIRPRNGVGI